jgi:hypothetical protein
MKIPASNSDDPLCSKQDDVETLIREVADDVEHCFAAISTIRDKVANYVAAGEYEKALDYLDGEEKDWRAVHTARQFKMSRQRLELVAVSVGSSLLTGVVGATVTRLFP